MSIPKLNERGSSIKISACLIAYKEEIHIRDFLENVSQFADELILVYDGESCEDKTLEIAEEFSKNTGFPVKIFFRPHTGNPESHRPFSFRQASYDWIFWMDSDERIIGSIDELKNFLEKNKEIQRVRLIWGTKGELKSKNFKARKPILFNKKSNAYFGVLGQKPILIAGKMVNYPRNVYVLHLETRKFFFGMIKKSIKWARANAKDHIKNISSIDKFNVDSRILEEFEKRREKKIKFSFILMFISPLRHMFNCFKNGKSAAHIISAGFQAFLFYFLVSFFRTARIFNREK